MTQEYETARYIVNSGNYTLLADILDELRINWPSTYNLALQELRDNIEWNSEE